MRNESSFFYESFRLNCMRGMVRSWKTKRKRSRYEVHMALELTVEGLGRVDVRKEFRPTQQPPTMLRILDPDVRKAAERLNQRYAYRIAKRLFDVLFSLLVIVLLSWLFLLIAIAVKIDDPSDPISFKQRVGKDGRTFCMWKFRSMHVDAEERLAALQALNEKDGSVFKIKADPRVAGVGRFIRMSSLDELPQFFNTLRGDMSIVGSRLTLPREVFTYSEHERQKLLIKPGVTGYWEDAFQP